MSAKLAAPPPAPRRPIVRVDGGGGARGAVAYCDERRARGHVPVQVRERAVRARARGAPRATRASRACCATSRARAPPERTRLFEVATSSESEIYFTGEQAQRLLDAVRSELARVEKLARLCERS